MGMTMTQKILARSAGLDRVEPGQLIEGKLDLVLGNDITTPVAITEFEKAGLSSVFDRERIAIVLDHSTPCKDIKSAQLCAACREFAQKHTITHFYDVGRMGIEHALLPEQGLTAPGEVIIGADSHTCTYGALGAFSTGVGSTDMAAGMATGLANLVGELGPYVSGKDVILHLIGLIGVDGALYQSLEFGGEGAASLEMDDRFTICNMAIEAGAKNGIFPVDGKTAAYLKGRVDRPWQAVEADPDAQYTREVTIDLSALRPTVAFPHLPSNTKTVDEAAGKPIQQVVIGSCTNGRLKDLWEAAKILRGRKVAEGVRCIVIPADLFGRHGRGACGGLYQRGRGGFHPHLRAVPWGTHGGAERRRVGDLYHQPEFRGAHGAHQLHDHPGKSGGGGGVRCDGCGHRPGQPLKEV